MKEKIAINLHYIMFICQWIFLVKKLNGSPAKHFEIQKCKLDYLQIVFFYVILIKFLCHYSSVQKRLNCRSLPEKFTLIVFFLFH